jgi:hypothetical protein
MQNRSVLADICNLVWIDLSQMKSTEKFLNLLASVIDLIQKAFKGSAKTQFFH